MNSEGQPEEPNLPVTNGETDVSIRTDETVFERDKTSASGMSREPNLIDFPVNPEAAVVSE